MNKLIKFELRRNRIKFPVYLGTVMLANIILAFINPDSEEITITLSILVLLLPFMYMCADFAGLLISDFYKDTKYFYLSSDSRKKEIFASRLLTTAAYAAGYVVVITVFQKANVLRDFALFIALISSAVCLVSHLSAVSVVLNKQSDI